VRRTLIQVLTCACLLVSVTSCGSKEKVPDGLSMDQLIQAGRSPVEIKGVQRSIGPVPSFRMTLANLSDRKVDSVLWTVLLFKADGKPLEGGRAEGGYAEFPGIAPGGSVDGMVSAGSDEAATARLFVREVVYTEKALDMEISKKWTNPKHDAEVAEALGR
jgi:hypothetical protein